MSIIKDVPVSQLRAAAAAWRASEQAPGFFKVRRDLSHHDRMEELVEEVARLRALLNTTKEPERA
jgi:hypothetical protein